jgi:hypothetical protein
MEGELVFCVSVVRVRPRTSRSITDLLLALAYMYFVAYRAPRRSRSPELSLGEISGHKAGNANANQPGALSRAT